MRGSPPSRWMVGVLLVLLGCSCTGEGVLTRGGQLLLAARDAQGAEVLGPAQTYAFGLVFEGQVGTGSVEVRNVGNAELVLQALEVVEGDGVDVGQPPARGAPFAVTFGSGTRLPAGGSTRLEVSFRAPVDGGRLDYRTRLRLTAANARPGADSIELTLTASTASGNCALPPVLHFRTAVGDAVQAGFTLTNPLPVWVTATIGALQGSVEDLWAFRPEHGTPVEQVELAPGGSVEVAYVFHPGALRTYLAELPVRRSESCPEVRVRLLGEGVKQVLTWEPEVLHFGAALPGQAVERQVTFHNAGLQPLTVSSLELSPQSGSFQLVSPPGASLQVPAEGAQSITLRFQPSAIGASEGRLTFTTSLEKQAVGGVSLKALGGGPDALLRPEEVRFDRVAFFPDAPAASEQRRRLVLTNLGTRQPRGDPRLLLRLGTQAADGSWGPPFFSVTPANADTQAEEFSLALPEGFDPVVGLSPESGDNQLTLQVVLRPRSLGHKEAWLTLFTNDMDAPEQRVRLVAEVEQLPPCRYSLSPAALDFGLVQAPDTRALGFVLTNLGVQPEEECIVSTVALTPESQPHFALDGEQPEAWVLGPGETLQVAVEARPPPASLPQPLTGEALFTVTSPQAPQGLVPLRVAAGTPCLLLAPDTLRFGVMQRDCRSQSLGTPLYNVCNQPLVVDSIQLLSAAGLPPGSAGCSEASTCPEFSLQGPVVPPGGLALPVGASLSLEATYRPLNLGKDLGLVAISVHSASTPATTYVVSLEGTGDTTGSNTDSFQQGTGAPKADILLAIDGSATMSTTQTRLAQHLGTFLDSLTQAGVDFHLAVVRGQSAPSNRDVGAFMVSPGSPEPFLTPDSPELLEQLQEKTRVGTSGFDKSCFGPALEALSPPRTLLGNAGFLREDAALSLICVSNDVDHSPEPVSYFRNAFTQLKRNPNLFTASAIAVFNERTCGSADNGRYAEMVQSTGGGSAELCLEDWDATMATIGHAAGGGRSIYFLTGEPQGGQGGLQVRLQGNLLAATGSEGEPIWRYDAGLNAVVFSPRSSPRSGEDVEVRYSAACH